MDDATSATGIGSALTEGVPDGMQARGVRREVLPARTWVKLGDPDGTEIYLEADANTPVLVRRVEQAGPRTGTWAQDTAGGAPTLRAGSVIEECRR